MPRVRGNLAYLHNRERWSRAGTARMCAAFCADAQHKKCPRRLRALREPLELVIGSGGGASGHLIVSSACLRVACAKEANCIDWPVASDSCATVGIPHVYIWNIIDHPKKPKTSAGLRLLALSAFTLTAVGK